MAFAPPAPATSLTSWRAALLALALLAPLNMPFSIPIVDQTKVFGWSTSDEDGAVVAGGPVVTRTTRSAREAGLLPGDRLLTIDDEPADEATIARRRDAALPGQGIRLALDRGGRRLDVTVPVLTGSGSYRGFIDFVIALALICWVTGVAVVAWRGAAYPPLMLGAALLLIPPSLFPSGVPGSGAVLTSARVAWQTLCVAEAFFLPTLLAHHAWVTANPHGARRRRGWWAAVYLVLAAALVAMTHAFTDPLAFSPDGWERELRAVLSVVTGIAAAVVAAIALRRRRDDGMSSRAMLIAIGIVSVATALSVASLNWLPGWRGTDIAADVESLTLFLLPCMVAFHLFVPTVSEEGDWKQQRWLATSASFIVTVAYAIAICGAVAVVLHTTGRELGGVQWLLFAAIFGSTIALWAPLRYVREMVDRRLLAQWVRQERRARSFGDRVATILEPPRIAAAVSDELPALLDVESAELIFVRETAEAWGVEHQSELTIRGGAEVAREFAVSATRGGTIALPVLMPDGALIAALRVVSHPGSPALSDIDREVVRTVVQGLASALGNARSYLRLRRTQQELDEAEHIAAIGAMASGLAHEIKNPLASLQMGLFLLERDGAHPGKIQRIRSDVSRIDDLVVGLRRYANGLAAESAALVDVGEIARACVDDVRPRAEDRRASIVEHYPDAPALARGSPEQFRLVIRSLMGNAIDSLRDEGTIVIDVSVSITGIRLTVADDGAGIPPEMRDRVFDLHFSTKPGGTGLGLTLARREISRLGGTIALEPGVDRGTQLSVTLPRIQSGTHGSVRAESTRSILGGSS
ncbi:MAG: ATP-binding protein [Gemmatimonadaceae bacterium]